MGVSVFGRLHAIQKIRGFLVAFLVGFWGSSFWLFHEYRDISWEKKLPGGATKIRTHKVCERLRKDTQPSSNSKKLEVGCNLTSNQTRHLQDIEPFQFYS